ncbi:MAG: FkbM family methyltransferase [Candidatus Azobacteroides sp.]|nr:FkbM family methyltransferase [Candidatus Azobacteroides sp.]
MALKITRIKLRIAKILYYCTKVFYKSNKQNVRRRGINFELYLNEGIDLHIFLLGGFQTHVYKNKLITINPTDIIFDVGANIGVMSLFFAKQAYNGFVYSFEPTYYAVEKFNRNMQLNPDLSNHIKMDQCFVSYESMETSNLVAYSSWPVNDTENEKHSIHCGVAKDTTDIPSISLDDYVALEKINKLDLIKIDTDGHEFKVLQGAQTILKTLRPKIILEIGIYIMQEHNLSFADYHRIFQTCKYKLYTVKGKQITPQNYTKHIPKYGTIDMIAIPL